MNTERKMIFRLSASAAGVAGLCAALVWVLARPGPALPRKAEAARTPANASFGGRSGYGWAIGADTGKAVEQALGAAGENGEADVTFVFYTTQHRPEEVLAAMQARAGAGSRVCGWSSDFGVTGPDGYHASKEGSLGLLRLHLPGLVVGVGGAELGEAASAGEATRLALDRATKDAGRSGAPSMVIMSCTYDGREEEIIEAIDIVTGGAVPVLGGTAGGSSEPGGGKPSVISSDKVIRKGVVLSVLYSEKPLAWAYRGGFDRTGKSGVITASDGRVIREIDGRPALDVYDEWSGGRVGDAMRAGKNLTTFTGLYPLCRTIVSSSTTHNLFVHAWPPEDGATSKCLVTSANLWKGDVVHFAEGSWNILLNRIGMLPQLAKEGKADMQVAAGLLICCEAVLRNIPPDQRDQISYLMNKSLGGAPWIGMFTWGEQGNFPGMGNYHGNLLTGAMLFPKELPRGK